ncbi:MAG: anaerobic ribonucleoside-triphosphate reductase activating protein [Synergistaceae bacterium]|jgi:anaerobic ribonucleoside-triphosphate reductase activating protein|nr:anaerobic ribonucleoside-triphosphate reductase activating protein [Synergistaceae bacterium]
MTVGDLEAMPKTTAREGSSRACIDSTRLSRSLRLSGIVEESIVDGPGIRYAVFTQGCPHRCPGCHNPQTHDLEGGYEISSADLIESFMRSAAENPLLSGVTITGGEPLIQAYGLIPFADAARAAGYDIWIYTGYTMEEITKRHDGDEMALLKLTDTLVDGRFTQELRTLEKRFIGSSNQRIISSPFR